MAFAKPIFTYRCGFGESLQHGVNAILTDGASAREWAAKLLLLTDCEKRRAIGRAARRFAEEQFDAAPVAARLASGLFPDASMRPARKAPIAHASAKAAAAVALRPKPALPAPPPRRSPLVRKTRKLLRNPRQFLADSRFVVFFRRQAAS